VARQEKRGDRFESVFYDVYAPRALAGIAGLKETLADRSLPVVMLRRHREERVARLNAASKTEATRLRDLSALAALTHVSNVLTGYDQAPGLLERDELDDRAVDLWAPLVALTLVADSEDQGDRTPRVLALARELADLRDADAESGQTARLVAALVAIRDEHGADLTPDDLVARLRSRPGWEWVKSTRRRAGLLNPLGLFRVQRRDGSGRRVWLYHLDSATLDDLRQRYGGGDSEPGDASVSCSSSG
jgi:hypothetical protein